MLSLTRLPVQSVNASVPGEYSVVYGLGTHPHPHTFVLAALSACGFLFFWCVRVFFFSLLLLLLLLPPVYRHDLNVRTLVHAPDDTQKRERTTSLFCFLEREPGPLEFLQICTATVVF